MPLSKVNLQALLEHAPQAIIILDREGNIVYVNALSRQMFGYNHKELLGRPIETLLPEHPRELHARHRARYLSDPSTRPMGTGLDLTARRKDGSEFPVEVGLSFVATEDGPIVASYVTDVTQRRQHEQELQQLNAHLERRARQLIALHEIGRTLAATLDLREIYWVMFREIAQELLGTENLIVALWDSETATIYCGFAIVDGEEIDPTQLPRIPLGEGPVSDTIRTREPRIIDLRKAFPQLKERGRAVEFGDERRPKSALYVPMIGGDQVVGVMQVQHFEAEAFRETDMALLSTLASQAAIAITNARLFAQEQERADALSRALEQQRELDRLKDEFIQNVSHELRTPLGIAHGYAELLNSGALGELRPEQKKPMDIIARRTQMLCKMVTDLTAILAAQTRAPSRELVYPTELVNALLVDFEISAEEAGLTLTAEVAPDLPPVSGNLTHLQRMLDNLLSNALKFTRAGGRIHVRAWQAGAEVVLEVADTGVGIPANQLERIFDRFYQVDGSTTRRYSGTGLGLALVEEIVKAHGGQVTVQSTVDEGSTFQVRLPCTTT